MFKDHSTEKSIQNLKLRSCHVIVADYRDTKKSQVSLDSKDKDVPFYLIVFRTKKLKEIDARCVEK